MSNLRQIVGQTYSDRKLAVDGIDFVRCRFFGCQLLFTATDEVSFRDCEFLNCDWIFDGAANITLKYLSMLYHQGGIEGSGLVDAVYKSLKGQLLEEPPASVAVPAMRP